MALESLSGLSDRLLAETAELGPTASDRIDPPGYNGYVELRYVLLSVDSTRLLTSVLFGVSPLDALTFAIVTALPAAAASAACCAAPEPVR